MIYVIALFVFIIILMIAVRVFSFQQAQISDTEVPYVKMYMMTDPETGKLVSLNIGSFNGSLVAMVVGVLGILGTSLMMATTRSTYMLY